MLDLQRRPRGGATTHAAFADHSRRRDMVTSWRDARGDESGRAASRVAGADAQASGARAEGSVEMTVTEASTQGGVLEALRMNMGVRDL